MRISDWSSDVCSSDLFDLLRLDVHLRAGDQIYVTGMGLESEWQADITLGGTTLAPRVTGEIDLVRGTLDFAGRSRSEEHTSELQSLMRISYAVFCLKKKNQKHYASHTCNEIRHPDITVNETHNPK